MAANRVGKGVVIWLSMLVERLSESAPYESIPRNPMSAMLPARWEKNDRKFQVGSINFLTISQKGHSGSCPARRCNANAEIWSCPEFVFAELLPDTAG